MGNTPTTEPSDLQAMEKALSAPAETASSPDEETSDEPKKKKRRVASGAKAPWMDRMVETFNTFGQTLRDTLGGLFSRDGATRRMSALFLLSLVGIVTVSIVTWQRRQARLALMPRRATGVEETANRLGSFASRIAEDVKRRHVVAALGEFTIELKKPPIAVEVAPGVMNMAEIQIVVECDTRETCAYIEKAGDQARHQVTNVFIAIDRDDLMSREGKRKLKKRLMERLNLWLPKGKIDNVFFTRLIIS